MSQERTEAQVRAGFVAAMPAGWVESTHVAEVFPTESDNYEHQAYAVAMGRQDPVGDRQRLTLGTQVVSEVTVHFTLRLRGDSQVGDYDLAMDAAQTLLKAIMAAPPTYTHIVWDGTRKAITRDGAWYLGSLTFKAQYLLALQ